MVIGTVITDDDEGVDIFVKNTNKRLESNNIVKNPFIGKITSMTINYPKDQINSLHILNMTVLYPNFTWFGWITLFTIWFIWGWSGWCIIPLLIGLLGFFWSKWFYLLIFYLGLKKEGYTGKFKIIMSSTALNLMVV